MTDFAKTRQMFDIPEGMIYLNGNSLGPMPKAAPAAMSSFLLDEWRTELIRGWNTKATRWGNRQGGFMQFFFNSIFFISVCTFTLFTVKSTFPKEQH